MPFTEAIRTALRSLATNKLRSALTMLGIIIGVGAVITLLAVGQGVESYVRAQFESIGTNVLFVIPGQLEEGPPSARTRTPRPLTMGDANALLDPMRAPDVLAVAPEVQRYARIGYKKKEVTAQVRGVTLDYFSVRNWPVVEGRLFTPQEVTGEARVVTLGHLTAERLFGDEDPVGKTVKINGIQFKVIGVMESKGGGSFGSEDLSAFVPITTAQKRLFRVRTYRGEYTVSAILVQAVSEDRMDAAAQEITEILRERHDIQYLDEDDFTVINQKDLINIFGDITRVLTIFLGAIAAISLLVGGIGIMNIMLVSVTERTREIGLRKALGAKRKDILLQFLIEAIVLSLIGGFVGILLGVSGALIVSQVASGLNALVTVEAVALATGFAAAVGLFFGIYPATRAARLNPIEALRYE